MGIIGISTPPFYIYCLKMTSIEELQSAQMFFAKINERERGIEYGLQIVTHIFPQSPRQPLYKEKLRILTKLQKTLPQEAKA